MNVERSLQVGIAALCCIGTISLGVGEDNYLIAALAVVVSFSSLILCDRKQWLQIGHGTSNVLSLAALAGSLIYAAQKGSEEQVLIMARLMALLQFILQFKAKSQRNYWLLATVSFLQMAVAAALEAGMVYAFLMTIYLFWALFFLGYFSLWREQQRHTIDAAKARRAQTQQGRGFVALPTTDAALTDAGGDFARRIVRLGFGTLVLAGILFAVVPRIGGQVWETGTIVGPRTVGFTPEIDLSRGGQTIEDPEVVMQVRFFDYKTRLPVHVDGDIYMRGTSVMDYDSSTGKWERGRIRTFFRNGLPSITLLASDQGLIVQRIAIEPLSRTTLFSCYPAFTDQPEESQKSLIHQSRLGQISRQDVLRTKRFEYEVVTPAFQRNRQGQLIPLLSPIYDGEGELVAMPPQRADGSDPLAGLKSIAAQVVADVPATDVLLRAKRLEAYLRDSGRFEYSLDGPERPAAVDPIEDFVVNRPVGHCEFYAGALAMMLRSVGIPARVVLGYRGGEFNVVGNFYEFQQLHAHSWVEVYLPPDKVPLDRLTDTPGLIPLAEANGAWLQLDGTAPASITRTAVANTTWSQIQQVLDYVRFLWVNYVVGMDSTRQKESVYGPLLTSFGEMIKNLRDPDFWLTVKRDIQKMIWTGGESLAFVLIFAAAIGLVIAAFVSRRGFKRESREAAAEAKAARRMAPPTEEFYLRMERLLAKMSLVRTGDQTLREWALAAGGELAELPHTRMASAVPRTIVDHYYRVRFGKRPLDDVQLAEVEESLKSLEAAVVAKPDNKPPG
ncbi:MAG: DUF3488 domain-containing protein [Planctomycetaceae bacterium]|nr:DUF3488 domain-containing protein [Planctomycetaceae bacterium]